MHAFCLILYFCILKSFVYSDQLIDLYDFKVSFLQENTFLLQGFSSRITQRRYGTVFWVFLFLLFLNGLLFLGLVLFQQYSFILSLFSLAMRFFSHFPFNNHSMHFILYLPFCSVYNSSLTCDECLHVTLLDFPRKVIDYSFCSTSMFIGTIMLKGT